MKNELIEFFQDTEIDPNHHEAVVGTIVELTESGEPLVNFSEVSEPIVARSTVTISRKDLGKEAVLNFERGNLRKPIIVGIFRCPKPQNPEVELDGKRSVFTAEKEIVLKWGESSITLTRAGKVLIRRAYLSSRSSGVHRIKGGSVQIN